MTGQERSVADDWYFQSFAALYPIVYAHRTVEAARDEARFSVEQTRLESTDRVLDLCCGNGRHMAHLIDVSRLVVGLDYSTHLLSVCRKLIGKKPLLVRGDMRHHPFEGAFDVVVNYFTSFGYFQSASENLAVVEGIARTLKPGGRFFIDYMNAEWATATLEPHTERTQDGFKIYEDRWIDEDEKRINKTTTLYENGRKVNAFGESVVLYSTDDFRALLEKGGLKIDRLFGDYTGAAHDSSHPRMIAVGQKA